LLALENKLEDTMNRRHILSRSLTTAVGLALLSGSALAQQKTLKEQLVGTWTLVSNDNVGSDGTKRQLFGPKPKGILILDANGHYAQIYFRADLPKFKTNNRLEGTTEENKAVVQGTSAQFGTWSLDEAGKTLTRRVEGSLLPNQVAAETKNPITLTADDLKMTATAPGSGGTSENVFKRVK
jgi:hypothetical protein